MGFASPLRFAVLALSLCFASAALAEDVTPPAPTNSSAPTAPPPAATPAAPVAQAVAPPAAAQPPAAQSLPADLQDCLQETGDYVTRGKAVFYLLGITNTCNARLRCMIYASVSGVRGTSLGHSVMILDPAGSGDGTKKTYDMRVRAAGGLAQVSRECKVF